jgi:hypothetical protein
MRINRIITDLLLGWIWISFGIYNLSLNKSLINKKITASPQPLSKGEGIINIF